MSADSTPGPEVLARHYTEQATAMPASLEAFWMPFTANKQFKAAPRLLASASGMYYKSVDGREVLDATAGLWCCNAGHAREPIIQAIQAQARDRALAGHREVCRHGKALKKRGCPMIPAGPARFIMRTIPNRTRP